jgi:hypothetical protein
MGAPQWYGYSLDEFYGFFAGSGTPSTTCSAPRYLPRIGPIPLIRPMRLPSVPAAPTRPTCTRASDPCFRGSPPGSATRSGKRRLASRPCPYREAEPSPRGEGSRHDHSALGHRRWHPRRGDPLVVYGNPERVWGEGSSGTQVADWINAWGVYVVRLYRWKSGERHLLDSIRVSRKQMPIVPDCDVSAGPSPPARPA